MDNVWVIWKMYDDNSKMLLGVCASKALADQWVGASLRPSAYTVTEHRVARQYPYPSYPVTEQAVAL